MMDSFPPQLLQPLPYLTAHLVGVGGTLKEQPEDFVVEEIPAYEPSGSGEHLFLWIEKRDLSAEELLRRIAAACRIPPSEIGSAGMKDRRGITRQYLSVPLKSAGEITSAESKSLHILRAVPHGNKLRTGHLNGNKFEILLRTAPGQLEAAERIASELRVTGFPNYFGDQRFGRDRENLEWGYGLLTGSHTVRRIPFSRRKFLLRLYLSSIQSALFNLALAERLLNGTIRQVLAGDVLQVVSTGGPFVSTDPQIDQERLLAGEVAVSGPIFGPRMKAPSGDPADWEARLQASLGLISEHWTRFPQLTGGTRRPYLIIPENLTVAEPAPGSLRFTFQLPPGVYATSLLREFQKSDPTGPVPESLENQ